MKKNHTYKNAPKRNQSKNKKSATYLVLGGYGEMGRITVHDLFETTEDRIVIAGRSAREARAFARSFKSARVKGIAVDVQNIKHLTALMKKCDIVINATHYIYNLHVMRATLRARISYVDLGGLFHMTKKQLQLHALFKRNGLTAVLGCGSTPGITNILAAYGAVQLDTITAVHVRFAGYDERNKYARFVLPYSIATLFDEFTKPAAVFTRGKLRMVAAMSDKEYEQFPRPIGKIAAYRTLHSELATFPRFFRSKGIRECSFKVSFDEQFIHDVLFLIELGLAKPENRDLAQKMMSPFIPRGPVRDTEYIRVRLEGKSRGRKVRLTIDCIAKSKQKWRAAAGAHDTGVPPSIIAQLILNKKIDQKGVFAPESCVKPALFIKEIKKRGMKVIIRKQSGL